ncbi:MAG: response regulator transcription factor [Candidatus Obscuribacterales bacterium]|nr:response regulator transcription factor [Candidatus Obscuribacterales bacterium]
MAKILIVEDDIAVSESLKAWLETELHRVDVVADGLSAKEYLKSYDYDLVILDWNLPGCEGIEVCSEYRRAGGDAYIIMLTGQSAPEFVESGLDTGADDYVTKPFDARELSARIRAMLRRPTGIGSNVVKVSTLTLDLKSHQASIAGQALKLMPLEFSLLEFMLRHPNEVFSCETLLKRVWSAEAEVGLESVYSCVTRLRRKLKNSGYADLIETVHGVGYKFTPPT